MYLRENPLIVQGDRSVLLEVENPLYEEARDELARFAELEKSPEHMHTYRLSPLSVWNAAAAGMSADRMKEVLSRYSKYDVPSNVTAEISDWVSRYGRIKLYRQGENLLLSCDDPVLMAEIWSASDIRKFLLTRTSATEAEVNPRMRGHVKQGLLKLGFPAEDLAGYAEGTPLDLALRETTPEGLPFVPRAYQQESAAIFFSRGSPYGGSGVVVLPCGAGKTIVGMLVMAFVQTETLILVTSVTAARQWIQELTEKTTLTSDQIGEYTGYSKEVRPVTICTYQILTYRKKKGESFPHFELFWKKNWGLIIYDEVHLLPAPVFRITAEIQAKRRLGLTATLVREDGKEGDVFSLIGPKKYDVPWKVLEKQGWIAAAECTEVRVPLPPETRARYAISNRRAKFRTASENGAKMPIIRRLLERHKDDQVLVIGQYLDQLDRIAEMTEAPMITGKTPASERDELYDRFRREEVKCLILSKVGNFAIDLPEANVAVQVSGTFGSRQEEAQRLGRILRPKRGGGIARFYSLVTRDSLEEDFAANRQLFLTEQGYSYRIADAKEVMAV